MKHLLFYDGECGFCDLSVQWVLNHDPAQLFAFAPLQGETAKRLLADLPPDLKQLDSLVLIENHQSSHPRYFFLGQGGFRIAWLLGFPWSTLGVISFLPPFLYNWGYRLVARNRHKLFPNTKCVIPEQSSGRFLP